MKTNSSSTELLLKSISSRLASRPDCRGVNYRVVIDHKGVSMMPVIYIYPNLHKRKSSDKVDVVSFMEKKLSNINLSDLVFGTYIYQSTFDGTKRRWVRI